jgi:hypothetical protein
LAKPTPRTPVPCPNCSNDIAEPPGRRTLDPLTCDRCGHTIPWDQAVALRAEEIERRAPESAKQAVKSAMEQAERIRRKLEDSK